jgi:23S rRNA (adenine2030-N6)-methyltransferase
MPPTLAFGHIVNYRHVFHAGNFADCFKHALLVVLLEAMQRKQKPFLVLDTHAGIGRYDLTSGPAERTGEWRDGIGKLLELRPPALAQYLSCIEKLGLYPGSPVIAAKLIRPDDRLVACELHPEDAPILKAELAATKNAAVHQRDGYAALRAFLPPPEKRALILIDPPFEHPDEFSVLTKNLASAYEKFKAGCYVLWYPIKHRAPVRNFFENLKLTPIRDVVAAEFLVREPYNPTRLNGCGLMIINPPFGFEAEAEPILQAFKNTLGEAGSSVGIERLIDE